MTSTTKLLATLTLALAAAVPAASAQTAPSPRLAQAPVLFVDPSLGEDTVAIAFRTVGHRYAVDVELAGTTVTRHVTLQKRTTERAVRHRLGC